MTGSLDRTSSGSDEEVRSARQTLGALSVRELLHQLAASEDALRALQLLVTDRGATTHGARPKSSSPKSSPASVTISNPARHPVLLRQRALIRELRIRRLELRRLAISAHCGAEWNGTSVDRSPR
jgi:hypothetical protein